MIQVQQVDATTFEVTVDGATTTTHTVHVEPDYGQKFTGNETSLAILVERSFEFLLEREPNTSILRSFDLSVISRYFPAYEREIRTRM